MLPSQPISHGTVSTSSTASHDTQRCLPVANYLHHVYRHIGLRSNHIHRLQLHWQTDPKTKIVASDFVRCCRILSVIECTCIEIILSCPGKRYIFGSPIVAPNYVKLQMAIKKNNITCSGKAMTISNWYGLYHGVYSQSARFQYSVSVHCPTSTCFTRNLVILYSYKMQWEQWYLGPTATVAQLSFQVFLTTLYSLLQAKQMLMVGTFWVFCPLSIGMQTNYTSAGTKFLGFKVPLNAGKVQVSSR